MRDNLRGQSAQHFAVADEVRRKFGKLERSISNRSPARWTANWPNCDKARGASCGSSRPTICLRRLNGPFATRSTRAFQARNLRRQERRHPAGLPGARDHSGQPSFRSCVTPPRTGSSARGRAQALGEAGGGPRLGFDFTSWTAHIVFDCRDDGRGLDLDAVRRIARERGLLNPADRTPDPQAVVRMLLRGGISTSGTVTEVSGRGIGLDIVRGRRWSGSAATLSSTLRRVSAPASNLSCHRRSPRWKRCSSRSGGDRHGERRPA